MMSSKSRFILKQIQIKGSSGSSNSSDLTRYVAKSKLDEELEGKKARLLFSEHDDRLTSTEARKFLSITGGELRRDEVLHYVLSFQDEKDFEFLGSDEEERRDKIASILRESLRSALASIGVTRMRWAAGIHRNTDNPHLHILFNKNAIEKATGDLIQINRLPSSLVAHNEIHPDGTKEFSYGAIINDFAEQVDAFKHERVRLLNLEIVPSEREILEHQILSKDLAQDLAKDISFDSISNSNEQTKRKIVQVEKEVKERDPSSQSHVHLL